MQAERGIKYTNEVYKNDSTPESNSDSCDPNNGLNKGGTGGGPPGGTGGGTIIEWGCELWKFPDGNGGYYYIKKNCKYT